MQPHWSTQPQQTPGNTVFPGTNLVLKHVAVAQPGSVPVGYVEQLSTAGKRLTRPLKGWIRLERLARWE